MALSLGQYFLYSTNNPIRQAHLDSMGMAGRIRQDSGNNSFGRFPGSLILFLNNAYVCAGFDIRAIFSVHKFL